MFAQAAGFAILATISPTALLVMAIFLGSANPRTTALLYVAGALLMTVAMAVAVLFILRAAGLNQPRAHDPRYGLRLGLGILALAAAASVARFRRIEPELEPESGADPGEKKTTGLITRLTARPRPGAAFAAGVILFAPSATFVAAVQSVATAEAPVVATVLALLIVVILTVAIVWLPLVTFLAAPEATGRRLTTLNAWLRANGRAILIGGLAIGGLVLIVNGAVGLASG